MVILELKPTDWKNYVGKSLGSSGWYEVTQDEINKFAEITGDFQWIHIDVEKAKRDSPYGGTIAHGNWLVSIVPTKLLPQIYRIIDVKMNINYGWNKIRFPAPILIGKRIKCTANLESVKDIDEGTFDVEVLCTINVEGEKKPCFVARKLNRLYSI